jgi:hypothetical protein
MEGCCHGEAGTRNTRAFDPRPHLSQENTLIGCAALGVVCAALSQRKRRLEPVDKDGDKPVADLVSRSPTGSLVDSPEQSTAERIFGQ